jgi:2-dehydropantoate 2-reductase
MKYVVMGAGAVGCYLGGRLAAAGHSVTLIGRPRVLDLLRTRGLTVTDLDGFKAHVPAQQLQVAEQLLPEHVQSPCTVLLCVKGGATSDAARELAAVCPPDTPVVSMQNGVENVARIRAAAPGLQAIAGMVPFNVVMLKDSHVHRGTTGALRMAQAPATQALLDDWNRAGLLLNLEPDMQSVQWGKLLLNLNNPINALSDVPLLTQLMDRDYRRVLAAMQREAIAALKAAGIRPAKVATAPPLLLPFILSLPNALFTRIASRMLRMDAAARSSMWEDFQLGRTTEIDDLCGAVVRLAQAQGTAAPANAAMCRLITGHTPGQRMSGAALRAATGT